MCVCSRCYAWRGLKATVGNTCDNQAMEPWRKESLNLQVGDFIIWQDEAIEMEGQPSVITPGMRGKVLSLHDGFHLDVAEVKPIPPKAIVQFENGMRLMVDQRMKGRGLTNQANPRWTQTQLMMNRRNPPSRMLARCSAVASSKPTR